MAKDPEDPKKNFLSVLGSFPKTCTWSIKLQKE